MLAFTVRPTTATQDAEFDLYQRLNRLPYYTSEGGGFGDIVSDIQAIINKAPGFAQKAVEILDKAGPHLDTVLQLVQDPALPQVVDRLKTLQTIEASKPSTPTPDSTTPTPAGASTGISKVVPVLDAAIFIEQHPAAKFAFDHPVLVGVGAAVVLTGLGVGIGYGVSRWRAKRKAAAPAAVGHRYRRR